MATRKMKISFSPFEVGYQDDKTVVAGHTKIEQTVNFFTISDGYSVASTAPIKTAYGTNNFDLTGNWNFTDVDNSPLIAQYGEAYQSHSDQNQTLNVYRQEVNINPVTGAISELTPYTQVGSQMTVYNLRDYTVSNNRTYRYIIYSPSLNSNNIMYQQEVILKTNWSNWSLTELHPVSTSKTNKVYTASVEDVWLFKYNVETGDQTQTISRSEQQTLGTYNYYSEGYMNYITGTVSCLLGSQMLPVSYITNYKGELVKQGGYQENKQFSSSISSNDKVNMLKQWRQIVYSSNPKLLKDRKGQIFLVTLTNTSNSPNENVGYLPDTISFTWTEIGSADEIQIIGD